ncbi:hypothetical protein GCM10010377_55600 [Streptomyces viridiviolaceus]|uniref:Uncharacterized protein n=1 Tax=Streptomyces viridiviolaceus TaxID=68282 RepID=A0ABW2E577_9ACTN|nr:hypothetical protein [Streptomyces viridiviolaceus]GHB57425.1 hypothetical protein GCM10010377_55600 [Streptomyces viridiviolaceus]
MFVSTIGRVGPAWDGEAVADGDRPGERSTVGPPGPRVPILIGGHSDRAVRRTVQYGSWC